MKHKKPDKPDMAIKKKAAKSARRTIKKRKVTPDKLRLDISAFIKELNDQSPQEAESARYFDNVYPMGIGPVQYDAISPQGHLICPQQIKEASAMTRAEELLGLKMVKFFEGMDDASIDEHPSMRALERCSIRAALQE